jgi:signal transduction histidine kinase
VRSNEARPITTLESGLRQVPFLQPLTDDQIAQLIERGKLLSLPAGETLFRKGDAGQCMYVILNGQVNIYLDVNEGNVVVLSVLEPGDFFGEMALVDGGPRSAGALTLSRCELFVLERAAFLQLLTASPELLLRLFIGMTERLRATDERYLKEEVAKQTIRADMERERHRSLAQMVAGVAHEVNTPLGIINTAASIIKRELVSETVTALTGDRKVQLLVKDLLETADLMQKNIVRAHTLIQSFKNLSVSQIVDTKEKLNLPEVVTEILELFSIQAKKAKLDVQFCHSLPEQQTWVGYRGHLSRILLNLLTNVERHAYPNGSGGKVEVTLSSEPGPTPRYVLAVRDHGRGISPENLPRIFEPFFTTARTQGGTGLGLSMVYNLVTAALHGTVNAESTLNQGTTMTITLPHIIPD